MSLTGLSRAANDWLACASKWLARATAGVHLLWLVLVLVEPVLVVVVLQQLLLPLPLPLVLHH